MKICKHGQRLEKCYLCFKGYEMKNNVTHSYLLTLNERLTKLEQDDHNAREVHELFRRLDDCVKSHNTITNSMTDRIVILEKQYANRTKPDLLAMINRLNESFAKLEKDFKDLLPYMNDHFKEIIKLRDHKTRQIDENRKVSRCLEDLKKWANEDKKKIDELQKVNSVEFNPIKCPHDRISTPMRMGEVVGISSCVECGYKFEDKKKTKTYWANVYTLPSGHNCCYMKIGDVMDAEESAKKLGAMAHGFLKTISFEIEVEE